MTIALADYMLNIRRQNAICYETVTAKTGMSVIKYAATECFCLILGGKLCDAIEQSERRRINDR